MDYHNTADYWEEEGHVTDSFNGCYLLWTIIPLSRKVSQSYYNLRVHIHMQWLQNGGERGYIPQVYWQGHILCYVN